MIVMDYKSTLYWFDIRFREKNSKTRFWNFGFTVSHYSFCGEKVAANAKNVQNQTIRTPKSSREINEPLNQFEREWESKKKKKSTARIASQKLRITFKIAIPQILDFH